MREGWEETSVTDALNLQNGYPFKPAELDGVGTPVVRIRQLYDEYEPLDYSSVAVPEKFHIKSGDIIFSWSGRIDALQWMRGPAFLNQHLFKVVPKPSVDLIPKFALFQLQHIAPNLHLNGTTMKHVTKKELSRSGFTLPPPHEQRRIVDLMDSVDAAISAAQVEVDAATELRAGVLTHELSNAGSDWEQTTLGGLLKLEYGKALPAKKRVPGDVVVYGSNGAVGTHNDCLVEGPGIVVGRKGTAGSVTWSDSDFFPIDTAYWAKVNCSKLSIEFAFHVLCNSDLPRLNTQTGVPGLNRENVYRKPVTLPPPHEQQRIVDTMAALDDAVSASQAALDRLRELRASMLQVLLSGEHEIPEAYDEFLPDTEEVCPE